MTERLKILVVDDEPVVLDSAMRVLASERFHVLTAPDAEAALQILGAEAPDIVISDLLLPGASGMKLLQVASEQDPSLLIIITTGYSTVENAVATLKHGAFDFLPKPFTFDELLSCVDRAHRAIELRLAPAAGIPGGERRGDYHLGAHTWARMEQGGSALLGVTEFMVRTINPVQGIELPEVDAELRQGGRLARLLATDGLAHNVWSPLGGRVLVCNAQLRDRPETMREAPSGAGWIARILPSAPESELANLLGP